MINRFFHITSVLLSFFPSYAQGQAQSLNSSCFNSDISDSSFNVVFRDTLKINLQSVVLLGEVHRVGVNFTILRDLIKHLNYSKGFRDVIVERSYAEAYLFNKYLESNDPAFLKFDVTWCEEMKQLFFDLSKYNSELTEEKKIRFYGIDAILSLSQVVLFLKTIMPSNLPPLDIRPFIDSLNHINLPLVKEKEESVKEIDIAIKYLRKEIGSSRNLYATFFGNNFRHLELLLKSKSTLTKPGIRNENMFSNFLRITDEFNLKSGIIGFFGYNHLIRLKSLRPSFATLLDESNDSPRKGNVTNVLIHYENSTAREYEGDIVQVPNQLETLYGKDGKRINDEIKEIVKCKNFVFEVPGKFELIKRNCDFMFYVTDAKPTNLINDK